MYINETQKRLLDALNQRKYLEVREMGLEVKAVDSRTTVLTVDGEKFAEVVYKNDFLVDATSNQTNFLIDEFLTVMKIEQKSELSLEELKDRILYCPIQYEAIQEVY